MSHASYQKFDAYIDARRDPWRNERSLLLPCIPIMFANILSKVLEKASKLLRIRDFSSKSGENQDKAILEKWVPISPTQDALLG